MTASDELSFMDDFLGDWRSKLSRLELRSMEQGFQSHEAVRMIETHVTAAFQVTDTDVAFRLKSTLRRLERHFEKTKEQKRLSRRLWWRRRRRLRRLRRMLRRRKRLRKNAEKKEEQEAVLDSPPESMPELVVSTDSDIPDSKAKRSKSLRRLSRAVTSRRLRYLYPTSSVSSD